ncbi:MAG: ATP-binding protein, partial [Myxococcota bacterium]
TKGPRRAGLGLSVASEIVARHGGQLRLAAAPTGGTRVELELPAADPPDQLEASTGSKSSATRPV